MVKKSKKPAFKKNFFEEQAWLQNQTVCGIDEVGRGCLAGPLVTGAVILPPHKKHRLLKDSKILTETERTIAYEWITKHCYWGIGILHNRIIDQHNIWQTTLLAMKKALVHTLASTSVRPLAILVDAVPLKIHDTGYPDIQVHHFIKGESKSTSIAAASIVAKVTRDRLMKKMDSYFPGYGFTDHKGYSTLRHKAAVRELGSSIVHRVSFLGKTLTLDNKNDLDDQQSIC